MAGASGNPCALFSPKLTLLDHATNHLPTVSFLYSYRHYKAMNLYSQIFDQIGVLDFYYPVKNCQKRQALIDEYPKSLISIHYPQKDSSALGQDLRQTNIVAHIPMGGILYPINIAKLLKSILYITLLRSYAFKSKKIGWY